MSESETVEIRRSFFPNLEHHIEAIQSLANDNFKDQKQNKKGVEQASDNKCEHALSFLAISNHVEIIRKIIDAGKNNLYEVTRSREAALGNSLVLKTIMHNVDVEGLIKLRRVCKTWEEEATIQLFSPRREAQVKRHIKMVFNWDAEYLEYQRKYCNLQELVDCCLDGPRIKLPLFEFHFHDVGAHPETGEVQADLSNFLSKYGHHIRGLHIKFRNTLAATCAFVRQTIFEWATSVQCLTFEFPEKIEANLASLEQLSTAAFLTEDQPKLYSLPRLEALQEIRLGKLVEFVPSMKFVRLIEEIMSSAVNLTKIEDSALQFIPGIVSVGKIGAVQCAELSRNASPVHGITGLAEARPQLTELEIKYNILKIPSIKFLQNLHLILRSSGQTLKTLRLEGRLDLAVQNFAMDVPILENLEDLHLSNWYFFNNKRGRILPPGFSLQVSCPRLKTLHIHNIQGGKFEGQGNDDFDRDNPLTVEDNSSLTVTTLGIVPDYQSQIFNHKWLGQALVMYPNVRILYLRTMKRLDEIPSLLSTIWQSSWKESLEELHVKAYSSRHDRDFFLKMDQVLTGFNKETCERLRLQRNSENCSDNDQVFERGPCILDMKNHCVTQALQLIDTRIFKGLKVFSLETAWHANVSKCSHVSITHALEPMRKRQNLRLEGFSKELAEYDESKQ